MSSDNRLKMNEAPEKYNINNVLPKRDAMICLKEYTHKFRSKKTNIKIIDIGSGDGSVTEIIKKYIPDNYESFIGCDLSTQMVEFANKHYQNERTKFIILNIEEDIPDNLKENFDYVFSMYLLHWITNQKKTLTNFYNLLKKDGVCFIIFLGYASFYTIFIALSKLDKWRAYIDNVKKILSPYYDVQDPDRKMIEMLKEVGFQNLDVKCRQMIYVFESVQIFQNIIEAIHPFNIPEEKTEDFFKDFINIARTMGMIDDTQNTVLVHYNLITVYCTK